MLDRLGAKNRLNNVTFSIIGERTIIAKGTQKFATKSSPTSVSEIPTNGMKYPAAAILLRKSIAGPGSGAASNGKNLVIPKNSHDRPSKILIVV